MLISVFTPSHDSRWLDEALQSLLAQTHQDWEWLVLLNNGAHWSPSPPERRVQVRQLTASVKGVGELKGMAVSMTSGPVLVELDHDDLLMPTALEAVASSLHRRPDLRFVYSDFAEIEADGTPRTTEFEAGHGWRYSDLRIGDRVLRCCHAMEATPHNVSLIWYAPNHLRAFTRALYDEAGGYDVSREVLDDQDLMCRMFLLSGFAHIDECLYLQRRHPANTQAHSATNAFIQSETAVIAADFLERLTLAWAKRAGLLALDLSPGQPREGYVHAPVPPVSCARAGAVGFQLDPSDSSVGVLRALDVLQFVPDKVAGLDEIHRVLAHAGHAWIWVPSTDGRGAFQDPRSLSYWNENSFWYVTDDAYRDLVPAAKARFQVVRLETTFPSEWHRTHDIAYTEASLIAIKGGPRQGGLVRSQNRSGE